jgi:serine/threonine-protein kinase HipA
VQEFQALPEAEQLVMCMADLAGIATVPHALVEIQNQYAYITKRVDRIFLKNGSMQMLAMEDFCQLDLRLTQDKYRGSYERCSKIIARYSARQQIDQTELFMRLVFSYLVGNSDMHLKNFSLLETSAGSGEYVLAPAYDLLPVNVVMPEDQEQFALALNGKKTNIRKKDFLVFADHCGLSRTAAYKMLEKLLSMQNQWISLCETSLLPEAMKADLIHLIQERANILSA